MNCLTTRKHDTFSEMTITKTFPLQWAFAYVSFQHVSSPKGERLTIELLYRDEDYMFLESGELVININKSKNIKLKPFDVLRKHEDGIAIESASYELSKMQLLQICNAETIDYKLSGNHVSENSVDFFEEYGEDICIDDGEVDIDGIMHNLVGVYVDKIQYAAQALYNAIYDSSAFIEELQQVKESILLQEKKYEEWRRKREETEQRPQDVKSGCLSIMLLLIAPIILGMGYAMYSLFV